MAAPASFPEFTEIISISWDRRNAVFDLERDLRAQLFGSAPQGRRWHLAAPSGFVSHEPPIFREGKTLPDSSASL